MCSATEPDSEDMTLAFMCRSGLTSSAIQYATAQQKRLREDPEHFARWTQRLIECQAQAALRAQEDADRHWAQCVTLVDEFRNQHAKHRRVPWIQWQSTRCKLLRAQDGLARWLAAPANQTVREQTLELVRVILAELSELEDDLKVRQPLAAKLQRDDPAQAPAEQISQLRLDTILMRCEAYLVRARLYERGSRDRVAAATNVEAEAGGLLDRTSKDWATRASLEVARATAWLDLDREEDAITLLQTNAMKAADPDVRVRAAVIGCEALIRLNKASQARAMVDLLEKEEAGPEWELAEIQLALAEIQTLAKERKEAEIAKLLARAKTISVRYGNYWQARADAILTSAVSSEEAGASSAADLVMVEVRQLLASDNDAAAIAKLIATSRNELSAGHASNAVQFAQQAAALLQRKQDWLAAADAVEEVAKKSSQAKEAPAGHLTAIWNLSQALKSDAGNTSLQQRYSAALAEHLQLWPSTTTTDQARGWQVQWLSTMGKQADLARSMRELAEQSTAPEIARKAIFDWTACVTQSNSASSEIAALQSAFDEGKFKLIPNETRLALLTSQILQQWSDEATTKRLQSEANALVNLVATPIERQLLAADFLLLAARAGDASTAMGTASVWNSSALSPELIEPIAIAVLDVIDYWPGSAAPEWAAKITFTEEQLNSLSASPRLSTRAIASRVRGLSPAQSQTAIQTLRAICKENEKLGTLQLHLAHALARGGETERKESSNLARKLAANSPAGSDLSYGARWRLLRNQLDEGKAADVQKATKLILATLANESIGWRIKFNALAKP